MDVKNEKNTEDIKETLRNSENKVIGTVSGETENSTTNKLTDAEIELYKAKYGKIYKIDITIEPDDETTLEYEFVFKKPQQASFDRYMRSMNNSPMKAARTFINDNIIEEQQDKLNNVTREYQAMIITINEKLLFALGLGKDSSIKKL